MFPAAENIKGENHVPERQNNTGQPTKKVTERIIILVGSRLPLTLGNQWFWFRCRLLRFCGRGREVCGRVGFCGPRGENDARLRRRFVGVRGRLTVRVGAAVVNVHMFVDVNLAYFAWTSHLTEITISTRRGGSNLNVLKLNVSRGKRKETFITPLNIGTTFLIITRVQCPAMPLGPSSFPQDSERRRT
jgi:hypothetical protein